MAEFGAVATLEVTIPDKELRDAQAKIENQLGDVSVNVDAQPSRQSPAAMTDGGFGDVETIMSAQLETLGDIQDELEKMGASGGPGGGGGGGAGSTILQALGARSVLGGIGGGGALAGGGTALAAGGIALGGGMLGKKGNDALRNRFPENFAPKSEGVSGTSYAYTEEGGMGGSGEPLIKPDQIQQMLDGIDMGLESQKPQWINELENFRLTQPKWVNKLDQKLQINEPSWVSKLNPFGSGKKTPQDRLKDREKSGDPNPFTPRNEGGQSQNTSLDVNVDGKVTLEDATAAKAEVEQWAREEMEKKVREWEQGLGL